MTNKILKDIPDKINFDDSQNICNELIKSTLTNSPFILKDVMEHLSSSGGKGVRPLLTFSAAIDNDGFVKRDAIVTAASIELIHMATLVHDDIIDDAQTRRGQAALQTKFGKKTAVISGDYLLCLALSLLSTLYNEKHDNQKYAYLIPKITHSLESVCLGEYRQHLNNCNWNLNVYEYLKTISGKTAALFEIATYAGACLSDCDIKTVKHISSFGRYLGLMFQILDDCKDYSYDEKEILKPVKHDISEGVVTLPLILAIAKDKTMLDIIKTYYNTNNHNMIIDKVYKLGGIDDANKIALRYKEKAIKSIKNIPHELKKSKLEAILALLKYNE